MADGSSPVHILVLNSLARKRVTVSVSLKELIFSSCKFYNEGIMDSMRFQELTSLRHTLGLMTN